MRRRGSTARLGVAVLALLWLAGCTNVSALGFRNDHRLRFLAPADRELVTLPLTLRWEMPAFAGGSFAVFVDRAPIRPGGSLRDVAKGDRSCRRQSTCPDAQYLADRGVYTASSTEVTIPTIRQQNRRGSIQLHAVVVVLLDSEGRRIGESAWRREFRVRKRTFG